MQNPSQKCLRAAGLNCMVEISRRKFRLTMPARKGSTTLPFGRPWVKVRSLSRSAAGLSWSNQATQALLSRRKRQPIHPAEAVRRAIKPAQRVIKAARQNHQIRSAAISRVSAKAAQQPAKRRRRRQSCNKAQEAIPAQPADKIILKMLMLLHNRKNSKVTGLMPKSWRCLRARRVSDPVMKHLIDLSSAVIIASLLVCASPASAHEKRAGSEPFASQLMADSSSIQRAAAPSAPPSGDSSLLKSGTDS